MMRHRVFAGTAAAALGLALAIGGANAQETIVLHGASQFNEEHAFTRAMTRFQELVQEYYDGPVEFVMHLNSELGLEKQYFEYMSQGTSVDYAIVSPAHMSTFSQAAPFIDAPFLFRDLDHWNAVLESRPAQADRRRARGARGRAADRLCRRRHAQHLLEHRGEQPRGDPGPEDPRAGRADLELDLRGDRHVADRDRLQRGLQRDPEQRHQRRRERGGRRRADEVLRGRAEPRHDPARDHDPAAVLLQGDLRSPARGPAGGDPARRQGSGRLRPRDRIPRRMPPSSRRWRARGCSSASPSRGATR